MNSNQNTIEFRNLTLGYDDKTLFENVNISFRHGEFTSLLGRNGSGKSTLLRSIVKLQQPMSGDIILSGTPINELSTKKIAEQIAFVSTEEIRVPNLKVFDLVGLGRAPYTNWIGKLKNNDKKIVQESLEMVGMGSFAHKGVATLSDGERQRVMIARALAQETPIILLDEPTAFLDLPNKYEICLLLRRLAHEKKKTIIFSTHDLNVALELCDKLTIIDRQNLYYGTTQEIITDNRIQDMFENTQLFFDKANLTIKLKTR